MTLAETLHAPEARAATEAATLAAYERWAPSYPATAHNPLMRAEQMAMLAAWPDVRGRRALDLACGSGRYARLLRERGAADVVALDVSASMLHQVTDGVRVRAGMMALPFASAAFDVVISGLALGHADDVGRWMRGIAFVLEAQGVLLYSDFHPAAHAAGLVRSFKDQDGRTWSLPHREFPVARQREAALAAGFTSFETRELCAGREICEAFPGSDAFYAQWDGLPLVLVACARR